MNLSIYIILTIILFAAFLFIKERKVKKVLAKSSLLLSNMMEREAEGNIIVDLEFEDGVKILESIDCKASINVLGDQYKKGYDFLVVKQKKEGSLFPNHMHKISSEFFYVVSGKIRIYFSTEDSITLGPGDCAFVKKQVSHSVYADEVSEYIIIAKPSLLKRAGSFYERIF